MRAELENEGYVVVRGLLDSDWIEKLKTEESRFARTDHALSVQVQLVHRSAVIREFVTSGPQIPHVIQALGPNVCFTHQQYVTKHADERSRTDVPWHQDNGYGRLEPPDDLTVWITLDDCDERNGCLWVVPGSHRKGLLPHAPAHGLMAAESNEEGIPLPMNAGDAVLFGSLLLHRSLPNETDRTRVAMYARYCEPHVIMVTEGNKPVLQDGFSWMVAGEA
ncbi:MAG: phytanoyl-CoA dioxygenase family protein [Pseudomonadales bacterium]|nr:phytanoyl-CoA dioxygenase family protein [Pseudomonadales bacterium]